MWLAGNHLYLPFERLDNMMSSVRFTGWISNTKSSTGFPKPLEGKKWRFFLGAVGHRSRVGESGEQRLSFMQWIFLEHLLVLGIVLNIQNTVAYGTDIVLALLGLMFCYGEVHSKYVIDKIISKSSKC